MDSISKCVIVCVQWLRRQPLHHPEASTWGWEVTKKMSSKPEVRAQVSQRSRGKWRWHFIVLVLVPWTIHTCQREEEKDVQTAKIQFPFPLREEQKHSTAEHTPTCKDDQRLNTCFNGACKMLFCAKVSPSFLQVSTMGGFFKCVREQWQGYQRGEDVVSSLPTVDTEGEDISPLSE